MCVHARVHAHTCTLAHYSHTIHICSLEKATRARSGEQERKKKVRIASVSPEPKLGGGGLKTCMFLTELGYDLPSTLVHIDSEGIKSPLWQEPSNQEPQSHKN